MSPDDLDETERFPWTRSTRPPFFDDHGRPNLEAASKLQTLSELRAVPVVVLVGERGSGKSDTLRAEYASLQLAGTCVQRLNLRKLIESSPLDVLHEAIFEPETHGEWHLLLDGYDEALSYIHALPSVLAKWARSLSQHSGLRLRIAARPGSAIVGARLRTMLREFWEPNEIQVRELVRLTSEEIGVAAKCRGLDADAFLDAVRYRRLEPLASVPQTLRELLDDHVQGTGLPATASEAYQRACDRACRETNPQRLTPSVVTDVNVLMAAAERMATALHICNAAPILTDDPTARVDGESARLSDLADGHEGSRQITEAVLEEILQSSLVTWIGDNRWTFAHRSVQEYLASQFLQHSSISDENVKTVLLIGRQETRHAVFAVRELAAWVATWNNAVFEDLLEHDPEVLVAADLASRSDRDRSRLVDALVQRAARYRANTLAPFAPELYRLDHPGLSACLGPHLNAPTVDDDYWGLGAALLIAESASADHRPVQHLLELAEAESLRPGWRATALRLLGSALTSPQVQRVKALAGHSEHCIAQTAAEVLWLNQRSLADLLQYAQDGTIAPERLPIFLDDSPAGLPILLEVMKWATAQLSNPHGAVVPSAHGIHWALNHIQSQASDNSVNNDAVEAITQALAALVSRADLSAHAYESSFPEPLREPIEPQGLRRTIAGKLLDLVDDDALINLLQTPLKAFPSQDRVYWAERYPQMDSGSRRHLAQVLRLGLDGSLDPNERERLQRLAATDPELLPLVEPWWNPPPLPDWVNRNREAREATKRQWRFDAHRLTDLIQQRPADAAAVRLWWSQVGLEVGFRTLDGTTPAANFDDVLDLTATTCCPTAGTTLRTALEAAAEYALSRSPLTLPTHAGTVAGFMLDDAPEVRALTLTPQPPNLAPEAWAGLALVLMSAQVRTHDEKCRQYLLREAVTHAGTTFPRILLNMLPRLPASRLEDIIATLFEVVPDRADMVTEWVASLPIDHPLWLPAVTALAARGNDQARRQARDALPANPQDPSGPVDPRWISIADLLLRHGTPTDRQNLWHTVLQDPDVTEAWIVTTASPGPILALRPDQQGQIYEHLAAYGHLSQPQWQTVTGLGHPAVGVGYFLSSIPDTLYQSVTPEAQTELARLWHLYPDHPRIPVLARAHGRLLAEQPWERPALPDLYRLANDGEQRIVHDSSQLATILIDALQTTQQRLTGPNGLAPLLWNRVTDLHNPTKLPKDDNSRGNPIGWWPQWEQDLSDLVTHLLELHLGGHRLIINREVQLDRQSRTDILVQARHHDTTGTCTTPVTVIIEVKGCWNSSTKTAAQTQLAQQYLHRYKDASGIFLVGYFDSPYWSTKKPNATGTPTRDNRHHDNHTLDQLRTEQEHLAAELQGIGNDVQAVILDCRPGPRGEEGHRRR